MVTKRSDHLAWQRRFSNRILAYPDASNTSGRSTPTTLDGYGDPTPPESTITDDTDSECPLSEISAPAPPGSYPVGREASDDYGLDKPLFSSCHIIAPKSRRSCGSTDGKTRQKDDHVPARASQSSRNTDQGGIEHTQPPNNRIITSSYTSFGIILFLLICIMSSWVGQGNSISFQIHIGRARESNNTVSATPVSVQTVIDTKTVTQFHVSTATITSTVATTATLTQQSSPLPAPSTTGPSYSNSPWYSFPFMRARSLDEVDCHLSNQRTEREPYWHESIFQKFALRDCLKMEKKGLRWNGLMCGGAKWEVETDPTPGSKYSDSKACWKTCSSCLAKGIKKRARTAECKVQERGSRCFARYSNT
ncbi:hypothetical protein BDZ91DRAFT_747521 [Kalaharituber pfeilii]|nr:hypothetical protein BDZ91DRAFT_747521 [Kalaharituber pfeilii]